MDKDFFAKLTSEASEAERSGKTVSPQFRYRGWAILVAMLLAAVGVVVSFTGGALFGVIPYLLALVLFIWWRWRRIPERLAARSADEIMEGDPRAPVLYLRSFRSDEVGRRELERVAKALKPLGPAVAVGRPDERLVPGDGVARTYPAEADWRAKISSVLDRAQLVVLEIGTSPGLAWEVNQVTAVCRPSALIVWVPPVDATLTAGLQVQSGADDAGYGAFREAFNDAFPKGLPPTVPVPAYITFAEDWTPSVHRKIREAVPPAPRQEELLTSLFQKT